MLNTELLTYKSKVVTDDGTNGGRMSAIQVVSGVVQNVWPHVPKAERLAGSTKYRKLFDKVANDDDEKLLNPGYYLDGDTLGEDWCVFAPGTQRNTQADWTGAGAPSRWYGAGTIKSAVTGGVDDTITVVMKDSSIADTVGLASEYGRLSDKVDPDSGVGNEDLLTCTAVAPSISGAEVTFQFTSTIPNSYAAGSKYSAIYAPGSDVQPLLTNKTDANNLLDETAVILDNIGTVENDITILFSNTTDFTFTADDLAGLPSGTTGVQYQANNPDFSKPLIIIPTAAWIGSPAAANTVTFTISPAAVALIQKRVIPPNCASLANNRIRKVTIGESEV